MPVDYGIKQRLVEIPDRPPITVKPLDGGMDVSVPPWHPSMTEGPVKSPNSVNTTIRYGRVKKAPGMRWLGSGSLSLNPDCLWVGEFEELDETRHLMRIISDRVEHTTGGAAWSVISSVGALTNDKDHLPDALTVSDLDYWVFANGQQPLKYWDGTNAIDTLSGSAPIGNLLAFFDDRIVVADVTVGGVRHKDRLVVSDDTDITDFSTGNSDDIILPPDSSENPSPIMGISALFTRFIVYRRHSIWEGRRTGYPKSPFSFTETVSDLGVRSKKSIARYDPLGDIFLGSDKQVYLYSGSGVPIPVGTPIQKDIRDSVTDFDKVYGEVDRENHLYWIIGPTGSSTDCNVGWVWDIDAFVNERRLVWYKREFPREVICMGFGDVPTGALEVLNDETRLIDDIDELIDDWQKQDTQRLLVFGGEIGWVWYQDENSYADDGYGAPQQTSLVGTHDLPLMGNPARTIWLDDIYVEYKTDKAATLEFSISTDGGTIFSSPIFITLPAASTSDVISAHIGLNVEDFLPRLRFLSSDNPEISGISFTYRDRSISR